MPKLFAASAPASPPPSPAASLPPDDLGQLYKLQYGRILATLIRSVRDITLAEDSLQDAFAAALEMWPRQGRPNNPVAWLMTSARHKAIDQIRRRTMAANKHQEMIILTEPDESAPVPQDTLRLIFTCCHPSLAREVQVALTLRTVCGLTTEEIARAFLAPLPTIAQRLVRAKAKIKHAGIPYAVPDEEHLAVRLEPVLAVVYLVFNEGYAASSGAELVRADLCQESLRLARQLVELLPDSPDAQALLALLLLTDARRAARTSQTGEIITFEDQDRARWDRAKIAEGLALAQAVWKAGPPTSYAVQAAIAALHAAAPSHAEIDWAQIAALYELLLRLHPSPVVELNRAVAVAFSAGLEAGLELLDAVDLPDYHLLPAARADLLRRLGRFPAAADAYREALRLVKNASERTYLERRLAEMLAT